LSLTRIEANRNFANKVWNAARFVILNLQDATLPMQTGAGTFHATYALPGDDQLDLADRWILSRLESVRGEATRLIGSWQLGEAGRQLYDFLWGEYCDWYIEACKVRLYGEDADAAQAARQVLAHVLEQSLRLLHPFMPFVTEAIWQNLPGMNTLSPSLMMCRWPHPSSQADAQAEDGFGRIQEMVRAIRNARSEYDVETARWISAQISAGEHVALVQENLPILRSLARLDGDRLTVAAALPAPEKAVTLAAGGITLYLPLSGLVDLEAERARLEKEMANVEKQIARIDNLLGNPGFLNKAPDNVVSREKARLVELNQQKSQISERLADLVV